MPDERSLSEDYAHGRRDGLRLALAILSAEEDKWAALLSEKAPWRTRMSREVRHKALQVAQKRLQTALNRLSPDEGPELTAELAEAIAKAGL